MTAEPGTPDVDRTTARAALLARLAVLADHGRPVPCLSVPGPDRGAWTSDDAGEQALAARACEPCAALTECREYGQQYPKEAGTYGGRTEHERRPALGRPATMRGSAA